MGSWRSQSDLLCCAAAHSEKLDMLRRVYTVAMNKDNPNVNRSRGGAPFFSQGQLHCKVQTHVYWQSNHTSRWKLLVRDC